MRKQCNQTNRSAYVPPWEIRASAKFEIVTMNRNVNKHSLQAFSVILFVLCLIILLSVLWFVQKHTFSSAKWKNSPETRKHIVADLMDNYDLHGMSEADVIQLLGEEDRQQTSFKGDRTYYPPDSTLVYYLGEDYMDSRWMMVSLDEGVVVKVSFGVT